MMSPLPKMPLTWSLHSCLNISIKVLAGKLAQRQLASLLSAENLSANPLPAKLPCPDFRTLVQGAAMAKFKVVLERTATITKQHEL
jgi:hypothetical protein